MDTLEDCIDCPSYWCAPLSRLTVCWRDVLYPTFLLNGEVIGIELWDWLGIGNSINPMAAVGSGQVFIPKGKVSTEASMEPYMFQKV